MFVYSAIYIIFFDDVARSPFPGDGGLFDPHYARESFLCPLDRICSPFYVLFIVSSAVRVRWEFMHHLSVDLHGMFFLVPIFVALCRVAALMLLHVSRARLRPRVLFSPSVGGFPSFP
jgi:hypothetical protein